MGYKLAGFDVIGFNEIDPRLAEIYIKNHNPKHSFVESICDFKQRKNLPGVLCDLDILDGSPPCSSFSEAGFRDKTWGKKKKFREGQKEQVLDTLFFDFIDVARKLQPKVIVSENVKGLMKGKAKKYLFEILKQFEKAGYYTQYFLLNSSRMGVPQSRERIFFICLRNDLANDFLIKKGFFEEVPYIDMAFKEKIIPFSVISDDTDTKNNLTKKYSAYHETSKQGGRVGKFGSLKKTISSLPAHSTLASSKHFHPVYKRELNKKESIKIQSFPSDFNFLDHGWQYILGMSVPPIMMANIAKRIDDFWLSKINNKD